RIHQLAKEGKKRAQLVKRLTENKERLIGGILLGNNLVNILATALATSVLTGLFGDAGVVYATAAMTLIVLVFGEVMPKTYAITHSERVSMLVSPLIAVVVAVLAPIVHVVQIVVRFTLRVFGVRLEKAEADVTE